MKDHNLDNLEIKKIFKKYIDKMIPKYKYMPEASKVIKIEYFLKKKQVSKILKQKPLDSERLNLCIKNDLLEEYFTSKRVIEILEKRTKNFISNSKIISSNSVKLTKLIKSSKKTKCL